MRSANLRGEPTPRPTLTQGVTDEFHAPNIKHAPNSKHTITHHTTTGHAHSYPLTTAPEEHDNAPNSLKVNVDNVV
ncbi:hypothetical protein HMPREF1861_00960 [Corynebacterium kroppenstedtii]|nr:hypothetical protein HMPREF1861_00960 [Corynebacterium kroppenstedtii]